LFDFLTQGVYYHIEYRPTAHSTTSFYNSRQGNVKARTSSNYAGKPL